ncbi:MAG: extracellular solute-binding protein, partial [Spirochaetes bacterium]|nr:extracellular solute-binding protein [Spirochaetota bacterium]
MKKIFLILAVIFIFSAVFTISCFRVKSNENQIRFLTFEQLPQQQILIKKIIADFEAKHPDIKVKNEFSPDPRKVLIEMAAGTPPDVFFGGDWNFFMLASKVKLADLTAFIKKDDINMKDHFDKAVKLFTWKGKIYGMPLHFSTFALAYNRDMFDRAGLPYPDKNWTWDDFYKTAKALTKDVNNDKIIDEYGTTLPGWRLWLIANKGSVFSKDGTKCVINSK